MNVSSKRKGRKGISVTLAPLSPLLHDYDLSLPSTGPVIDSGVVQVAGWLCPAAAEAVAVEILSGTDLLRRIPVHTTCANGLAPSGAARHQCFDAWLDVRAVRTPLSLTVQAILSSQERTPLATLRIHPESCGLTVDDAVVSVVIPCYRQSQYLAEAIESALAQSYARVEIVVVVDGSPDNAAIVASRYPGVTCLVQRNSGLAAARNAGLHASSGEYLIFLDADDRLLPHAAELGVSQIEGTPGAAFASGFYRHIDMEGTPLTSPPFSFVGTDPYGALLQTNYAGTPSTTVYRRDPLALWGGFDDRLDAAEDYDLNLRLALRYPVVPHGGLVAEYRQHAQMMSRDVATMLKCVLRVLSRQPLWAKILYFREYRKGRKAWRAYYGVPLSNKIRRHLEATQWSAAVDGALCLLRHHPYLLLKTLLKTESRPA